MEVNRGEIQKGKDTMHLYKTYKVQRGLLRSLISNLMSKVKNSKWWIQNSGQLLRSIFSEYTACFIVELSYRRWFDNLVDVYFLDSRLSPL